MKRPDRITITTFWLDWFPKSNVWRVEGAVKLGVGIVAAVVLIITAL